MKEYSIFISYRRDGGESLACLLCEKLKQMSFSVFYDVESLRSGKFNEKIFQVIENCTDVLLVLPPNGLSRCNESEDWVRMEIAYAIQKQKNIIPIMMRNFEWPRELPAEITELRNFNGVSANMEYFDASFHKIISMLHSKNSRVQMNETYHMIYYSFSPFMKFRRIDSTLHFKNGTAALMVNEKNGKYEYTYSGRVQEDRSNIYVDLQNDLSEERVTINFAKAEGVHSRLIGLLMANSPTMSPVCFKVACFQHDDLGRINEELLKIILSHENKEFNDNVFLIESYQKNLFYSDVLLEK